MIRRVAAVALLVLFVVAAWVTRTDPVQAAGASVIEIGWWTSTASTTTPPGGFEVGKTPDGADSAVAAFRIKVDGDVSKAILILNETSNGQFKEGAGINACPTTATWTVAAGGPIADAPAADCDSNKLALARNPSSDSWTVDLTPLLTGKSGEVSIVLKPGAVTTISPPTPPPVPNPAPVALPTPPTVPPTATVPAVVDPGFTVEFDRADLDSTGAEASSSDDESAIGGGSAGSGAIATGDTGSTFSPTFSAVDTFATSAAISDPTGGALPAATADVTPQGAGGAGTAAKVETGLQPVAAAGQRGTPPPWGRLLFLVPLSIAIGAFGTGLRRTVLGRSGTAATAG